MGVQGTAIVAEDRNAAQEELIHVIEGGGLTPSAGNLAQLLQAVETITVQRALTVPSIGTIWLYDGTGWVDNVTVPGWYACIPGNLTHRPRISNARGGSIFVSGEVYASGSTPSWVDTTANGNHHHSFATTSADRAQTHTHQIDVPAYTGTSGATGAAAAIDNRPAHYAMIFIRRCY